MTTSEPRPRVEHPEPLPRPKWCTGVHLMHLEGSYRYVFHLSPQNVGVYLKRRDEWFEHEAVRGGDWNVWRVRSCIGMEQETGAHLFIADQRCARDLLEYEQLFKPGLAETIRTAAALLGWVVE